VQPGQGLLRRVPREPDLLLPRLRPPLQQLKSAAPVPPPPLDENADGDKRPRRQPVSAIVW
jgi:hypothetical protein